MAKNSITQKHLAKKGLALLKSLAADCEGGDDDHSWRECRHCLASEECDCQGGRIALRALILSIEERIN